MAGQLSVRQSVCCGLATICARVCVAGTLLLHLSVVRCSPGRNGRQCKAGREGGPTTMRQAACVLVVCRTNSRLPLTSRGDCHPATTRPTLPPSSLSPTRSCSQPQHTSGRSREPVESLTLREGAVYRVVPCPRWPPGVRRINDRREHVHSNQPRGSLSRCTGKLIVK